MAKGGARINTGPPPDPNALRRSRDGGDWTRLPKSGREGPAPVWPLTRMSVREREHWDREWKRPQALMWEALGMEVEVALYVRTLRAAESTKAPAVIRTLVKQQMDALGLSAPGLARNRWTIVDDEVASPAPGRVHDADRETAKARFRAIAGGAAS